APPLALSLHDALPICYEAADERRSAVRLLNPLADDEPLMRTELLQTLLPTARRNLGRGEEAVAIFQHGTAAIARGKDARSPLPRSEEHTSELQSRFDI